MVAHHLLATNPTPAGCRSAVSRGYYALYHHAKRFVEDCGATISDKEDTHVHLVNHFDDISDEELHGVGILIDGMKKERNAADYRLSDNRFNSKRAAEAFLQKISTTINMIDKCNGDLVRMRTVKPAVVRRNRFLRLGPVQGRS